MAAEPPNSRSLRTLAAAARGCTGCELYANATQTVFGEGAAHARVMLVGEQPGDHEDREGHPFVGPAGRLLDDALDAAGIDRASVYVTNAVKHFKWQPRGKRRIHATPNGLEIAACRPWLDAEMTAVDPDLVVCLGATASQALLGRSFRVTQHRGEVMEVGDRHVTVTVHPSSILRAPDDETRRTGFNDLVRDLRLASTWLTGTRT